jgi:hypothetical protein
VPTLIVVDPGQHEFAALCDDCVRERTGGPPDQARLTEEERRELCIEGDLALDCDSGTGTCGRGHPYSVVREGSEGGRH